MPESIVVGTDGSERAACAIEEATRLAEALGAQLHIVSAFEPLRGARIPDAPAGAAKVWAPLPDAHVDAVLGAAPKRATRPRVFVPLGTAHNAAAALRREGFATVAALAEHADAEAEACRMECTHLLRDGAAVPL